MLKKFIGPEKAEIVINGTSYGELEPGESLSIPDEIGNVTKWNQHWIDVKPKKANENKENE